MSWWSKLVSCFKKKVQNQGALNGKKLTPELRKEYEHLYEHLEFRANKIKSIDFVCDKMLEGKERYKEIENKTKVPWHLIAGIHLLECGGNFEKQLLNGQSWNQKTTIVPKGKGPFKSWEEAAEIAMNELFSTHNFNEWCLPECLYAGLRHHGIGVRLYHATFKDYYIWAGSNHYTGGGYYADGKWSSSYQSRQIGIATMYKRLEERGEIQW